MTTVRKMDGIIILIDSVIHTNMTNECSHCIATEDEAQSPRFCLRCGYRLNHLTSPRCPECGKEFDPNDTDSFAINTEIVGYGEFIVALVGILTLWAPPMSILLLGAAFASSLSLVRSRYNPTTGWLIASLFVSAVGLILAVAFCIPIVT